MAIDHSQSAIPKPGPREKKATHSRKKRTVSRRKMVLALDKAARHEIVVERDEEFCQRCGIVSQTFIAELMRPAIIQWAHVQTREYYITRWEPDNSLALCDRCHVWFDNHKVESYDWFAKKYPERWERIQRLLQSREKVNVKELYEAMGGDHRVARA